MKHTLACLALNALLLSPLTAFSDGASPQSAAKPNLVIILTDDQGRGDYSAFGTKDIRTPHMDRLFREGMTFHNFYANSCVCSPSRASLLTGCYPDRVGVPGVIREETPDNNWGYFSPGAILLPQLLKQADYHTALIGKWHLGSGSPNTPTERGFDFFHGFHEGMMDDYWTHLYHGRNVMRRNQEVVNPQGHATDIFTGWACDYLDERAKAGGPFFLYLAYNAPHDPVQPPSDWLEKVKQREPGLSEKRSRLVALIEHLDSGIGKVLEELDRTGLATNTLVIFTSDNGGVLANGANNGPWRGGKEHMYEGGPAYGGKTIDAFRRDEWKLLQDSPYAPLELYNLKSDPRETTNLAAKNHEIFNALDAALSRQIQIGGSTPWQKPVR